VLQWLDLRKEAEPIDNWLVIKSIQVPDHVLGEDAAVIYDREIKRPFIGTWTASVEAVPANRDFLCRASGVNDYQPGDALPSGGVTLSLIFGAHCPWYAGNFVLRTAWEIRREGYDIKVVRQTSRVFRVLPKGSQLDLTPEQVEKLEAE